MVHNIVESSKETFPCITRHLTNRAFKIFERDREFNAIVDSEASTSSIVTNHAPNECEEVAEKCLPKSTDVAEPSANASNRPKG